MGGFSRNLQSDIAQWIRGTTMPPPPQSLYLAISLQPIKDDGTGFTEPSDIDGYSRQPITLGTPTYKEGVGTSMKNATPAIFGPSTVVWTGVQAAAILDHSGNILIKGNLAAPRTAPVGDTISFGIGALEFVVV